MFGDVNSGAINVEESGRAGGNCYGGLQGKTLVFQNQDSFEDQSTFQLYFPSASD